MNKPTPEELIERAHKYRTLCRTVFSTAQGRELLQHLIDVYCKGALYHENERTTAYLIGQRDTILEMASNVEYGEPTNANE